MCANSGAQGRTHLDLPVRPIGCAYRPDVVPGSDDEDEVGEDVTAQAEPTPGERLLYVLGQIFRRWHAGTGLTSPKEVDIEDLARMLGVWSEVEFAQTDATRKHLGCLHFPTEVLVIDRTREFPWRLLSVWEWAREQELDEFWTYFH